MSVRSWVLSNVPFDPTVTLPRLRLGRLPADQRQRSAAKRRWKEAALTTAFDLLQLHLQTLVDVPRAMADADRRRHCVGTGVRACDRSSGAAVGTGGGDARHQRAFLFFEQVLLHPI